jgi:hypothetical protein
MTSSVRVIGRRALIATLLAPTLAGCAGSRPPRARPASLPRGAIRVDVGAAPVTGPRPPGFIGLSIEYPSLTAYAGQDPGRLDPAFLRLVRALNPGQAPVIRLGGDTTDWTWWPVRGMRRPPGIRDTLNRRYLAVAGATARALGARLILGINLEAGRRVIAATEARVLVRAVGRAHVTGLELGNEPEAYSTLGWYYRHHVVPVPGRPPGYGLTAYLRDVARFRAVLPPGVPLAGPASGAPVWLNGLGRYLDATPGVAVATFHRYPLHRCTARPTPVTTPTITNLLRPVSSRGPATSLRAAAAVAHAHGVSFRADELNSVSCGGAPGVSDTFAAALWGLDTLFNMERAGVDGVNIHTFRTGRYAPFTFARRAGAWSATVRPLYYGLLLFSRTAPAGSRLLATAGRGGPSLRVWTTRAPDGRTRVLIINAARDHAITVAVRLAGQAPAPARLERLTAPSAGARYGVRFGGQSFTRAGRLTGRPRTLPVPRRGGRYLVRLDAASAALLTVR